MTDVWDLKPIPTLILGDIKNPICRAIFFSFRHTNHKQISPTFVTCSYLWVYTNTIQFKNNLVWLSEQFIDYLLTLCTTLIRLAGCSVCGVPNTSVVNWKVAHCSLVEKLKTQNTTFLNFHISAVIQSNTDLLANSWYQL